MTKRKEKSTNKKNITNIIILILIMVSIIELVLLLNGSNKGLEKSKNGVKPIYNDDIKLGDTGILFDSANVNYNNTNSGLTSTKVQNAIDELYGLSNTCQTNLAACQAQIPQTCSNSPFHLGDYINMTPTSTSFTPDRTLTGLDDYDTFKENAAGTTTIAGTLNPSELNVWRVIRINGDCTVEVVSEYVSSVNVKFASKVGYMNYVYYLNEIAKKYANTTYTLNPSTAPDGAFRNVGYDGQMKQITDTTRLDDQTLGTASGAWYQKTTPVNGEESLGGGDLKFTTDIKLLADAGVSLSAYKYNTTTSTPYWLASRHFYWDSASYWHFRTRYMYIDGNVNNYDMWLWDYRKFYPYPNYSAVRPIVTLKSGLTISSGSGTSSSHYTLSAS